MKLFQPLLQFFRAERGGPLRPWPQAPDPEAWQAGDLAECVTSGVWVEVSGARGEGLSGPHFGPETGSCNRVIAASPARGLRGPCFALEFAAWPGHSFASYSFRKIRPCADAAVPADAAFAARLRPEPVPVPVPAPAPAREPEEVAGG